MRPVRRDEILDFVTYGEARPSIQPGILAQKRARRVHVGPYLTLLFENTDTVRYQIHEMIRTERIVKEAEIRHEIDTYNELLGGPGELGCTLMVEIAEAADRPVLLARWMDLPGRIYARLADGTRVAARFDERQVDERRLSAVQYIKFPVGGQVPVAFFSDHPEAGGEAVLTDEQREALAADLRGD